MHVVHVWHTGPSPHFDHVIRSGLEDVGREALEEQVRWIEEEGGTVAGAYLMDGQVVEANVEQAEEIGAGLVIVGSRGWGGSDAWRWAVSPRGWPTARRARS